MKLSLSLQYLKCIFKLLFNEYAQPLLLQRNAISFSSPPYFLSARALFFCSSVEESLQAVKRRRIKTPTTTVYLSRCHRFVNVIDTNISRFRGWISVRGLPFDSWCMKTFETIANQYGGLLEVVRKTLTFLSLSQAVIRVKASGASTIPQIISFKLEDTWIPIQLTPLFTMETAPQLKENPDEKQVTAIKKTS